MKSPRGFLLEVKNELKKVSRPKKQVVINLTLVVIFVSVLAGLFLTGIDFIFNKFMKLILGR